MPVAAGEPRPSGGGGKDRTRNCEIPKPESPPVQYHGGGVRARRVSQTIPGMVRDLGQAERLRAALALSDAQLLERFALHRDEAAFEAIVHRHGPLVFG